jgi:uncharacterized protein (DUF58 family)
MGLFVVGLLLAGLAFWHTRLILVMVGWDVLLLLLWLVDALALPRPEAFTVTRSFLDSPQLGQPTRVELAVTMMSERLIDLRATDDLHPSLVAAPKEQRLKMYPREPVIDVTTVAPVERGDVVLGRVFLRYRGALRLAERWCAALPVWQSEIGPAGLREDAASPAAPPDAAKNKQRKDALRPGEMPQHVRVYPALEENRGDAEFYLLRARQIEMQKRKLRLRGTGRDFESLRDYQPGDELRNISWTATARRTKLVTRQFTVERSQQVWIVLDAGRLSRTGFELRRGGAAMVGETEIERDRRHLLTVTQLDQATSAAAMLAQVVTSSGDKFGLLTYGRGVQQMLPPGAGPAHVRLLIDLLSQTKSERAEADHLAAIARLKNIQTRRGLMVWVTELTDSVGKPEVVLAAAELARRHLVVLVLLKHPELDDLAAGIPRTRDEMFHSAAALEMLERRREAVAQLERQGVLIVETTAQEIGINTISKYLEVKAQGLL